MEPQDSDLDDLPLEVQMQINVICDEFESGWNKFLADPDSDLALRPSIDEYSKKHDASDPLLRELLTLDTAYRVKLGEKPGPDDYRELIAGDSVRFNDVWRSATATDLITEASRLFTDSVNNLSPSNSVQTSGSGDGALESIGRFRVRMRVGEGGFGSVYLAYDDVLNRDVAIKMPHLHRFVTQGDVDEFLKEARIVAALDHPNIVPIFDLGTTDDDRCYVVAKWINGESLAEALARGRFDFNRTAEIVSSIAEALQHAHLNQISHRDIKPANILIDKSGTVYLTDFGMAEREYGKRGRLGGTPAYMSPEQARGEGHLVDARSDIYSLGAVLFELLCGSPPRSSTRSSSFSMDPDDVATPSEIVGNVPAELERICLKATARRAADRYQSAIEFLRDLEAFQKSRRPQLSSSLKAVQSQTTPKPPASSPTEILPRGLRSFTADDAESFVRLLPGPYGHDNVPEGIRAWKQRLESASANKIFRVGVIYGPSGCGKSSFVKAGLIPRLGDKTNSIYIEANGEQTPDVLLRALRHKFPGHFPSNWTLAQVATAIRQRQATRSMVVFIDQFEQWLQSWDQATPNQLVRTLRQADGVRLKFVLLVRDDFWLGLSRLMREVEIPLVEGENSWLLDLFDKQHARRVLTRFGQSLGKLPSDAHLISDTQIAFVERAIEDLSEDGRVICVKLALFTEMMKSRPWTVDELQNLGGAAGIGFEFLEETFSRRYAPPEYRRHEPAARQVLTALLSDSPTSSCKGHSRSRSELKRASGYVAEDAFDGLLRILDRDLRLITPVDANTVAKTDTPDKSHQNYQLAHDYLVPSLRRWLVARRSTTQAGRASALLEERSMLWASSPRNQLLPSFGEWTQILLHTKRGNWKESERKMMAKASRLHRRTLGIAAACVAIAIGLLFYRSRLKKKALASQAIRRLIDVEVDQVPAILPEVVRYESWLAPKLRTMLKSDSNREATRSAIALAANSPEAKERLANSLLSASPKEFAVFLSAIDSLDEEGIELLTNHVKQARQLVTSPEERSAGFRAAVALTGLSPDAINTVGDKAFLIEELSSQSTSELSAWSSLIKGAKHDYRDQLRQIYQEKKRGAQQVNAYQTALQFAVEHADSTDSLEWLTEVCCDANEDVFHSAVSATERFRDAMQPLFHAQFKNPGSAVPPGQSARRQVNAVAVLSRTGNTQPIREILDATEDHSAQTQFIHVADRLGVSSETVLQLLRVETDPQTLYGLLLCLGELQVPDSRAQEVLAIATRLYSHPDAGVHAASAWLLAKIEPVKLDEAKSDHLELQPRSMPSSGFQWFLDSDGRGLVVVPVANKDSEGEDSAQPSDEKEADGETPDAGYSLAVMCREVSRVDVSDALSRPDCPEEFNLLIKTQEEQRKRTGDSTPRPFGPRDLFDAVAVCNLMSWSIGLPRDQWCYELNPDGEYALGIRFAPDIDRRKGYRMPRAAEWAAFINADTTTPFYFGATADWIGKYEWCRDSSYSEFVDFAGLQPVASLKPSPNGFFDLIGNLPEWTQSTDFAVDGKLDLGSEFIMMGSGFWTHAADCEVGRTGTIGTVTDATMVAIRLVRRYKDP